VGFAPASRVRSRRFDRTSGTASKDQLNGKQQCFCGATVVWCHFSAVLVGTSGKARLDIERRRRRHHRRRDTFRLRLRSRQRYLDGSGAAAATTVDDGLTISTVSKINATQGGATTAAEQRSSRGSTAPIRRRRRCKPRAACEKRAWRHGRGHRPVRQAVATSKFVLAKRGDTILSVSSQRLQRCVRHGGGQRLPRAHGVQGAPA
jgi:hypothetical protein